LISPHVGVSYPKKGLACLSGSEENLLAKELGGQDRKEHPGRADNPSKPLKDYIEIVKELSVSCDRWPKAHRSEGFTLWHSPLHMLDWTM